MSEPDPEPWPSRRESAIVLAGFLRKLAAGDRHVFDDGERSLLRASAGFIARSIGRPDLAPGAPAGEGSSKFDSRPPDGPGEGSSKFDIRPILSPGEGPIEFRWEGNSP